MVIKLLAPYQNILTRVAINAYKRNSVNQIFEPMPLPLANMGH